MSTFHADADSAEPVATTRDRIGPRQGWNIYKGSRSPAVCIQPHVDRLIRVGLLTLPLVLAGCHGEGTLRVEAPPNYSGHVVIHCTDILTANAEILLSVSPSRMTAECPTSETRVLVTRNGTALDPAPKVVIDKVAEDLPATIRIDL